MSLKETGLLSLTPNPKPEVKTQPKSFLELYPDIKDLMSQGKLPRHIGFILDGNGRWAKEQGLPVEEGHKTGAEAAKRVIKACSELGIDLSVWILSPDNIKKRSRGEIRNIYNVLGKNMDKLIDEALEHNSRIIHAGETKGLPLNIKYKLWQAQRKTKEKTGPVLTLAINYSGDKQLISLANKARGSRRKFQSIEEVSRLMYGDGDIKPCDLIIRTGGDKRMSGFQEPFLNNGTELLFTDTYLPGFTDEEFHDILINYTARNKTHGGRASANQEHDGTFTRLIQGVKNRIPRRMHP